MKLFKVSSSQFNYRYGDQIIYLDKILSYSREYAGTKSTRGLKNKSDDDLPLLINVRSQMSSLEKNYDTILERAFAENVNLRFNNNYVDGLDQSHNNPEIPVAQK